MNSATLYFKKIAFIVLLIMGFSSCSRQVEDIFDTPATERTAKVLENCKTTLQNSPNGWYLDYTTPDGYNAQFVMKFSQHDSVLTYADFSDISSYSSYSLNYGQGPVLSFDSYGQLHTLSDPETSPLGLGHGGDFEFIILSVSQDSIILSGRKNRDRVILHRAISGEANRIRFMKQMDVESGNNISFFHSLTIGGDKADILLANDKKKLEITIADGNIISSEIKYTPLGFDLLTPVTIGGVTVDKFIWSDATKKFGIDATSTIEASNSPSFSTGSTVDQVLGAYYNLTEVSPALSPNFVTLKSAFANYRESEIYLNVPTKFVTKNIKVVGSETTVTTSDTIISIISYSFLFDKANVGTVWNNFKGSKITKLRGDQMLLTQSIRDGENASELNTNKTVRNIPLFFYNTSGLTVFLRDSDIYIISMKDGKSWLKLKKGVLEMPIQTLVKTL
ncbi:MAG: DUF4302 domain-containing protein [Bacteroidales bacterium]|nr:DUF4302 domain-containing protein [Bacteroidales bacterium]